MKFAFPNIERAKKSAKALATISDKVSLSTAQRAVAELSGHRDWHDLESRLKNGPTSDTQRSNVSGEERDRVMESSALFLAEKLSVDWSTALYGLSIAHFPGIPPASREEYERVWLRLMYRECGLSNKKKEPGCIVKIKSRGYMGCPGYLRNYDSVSGLITHYGSPSVADFEVSFPQVAVEPFIPARLKYIYGYWTEKDGAKVLFSRDYKPLWRICEGRKPERLQPWLWIDHTRGHHFWDPSNPPWFDRARASEEEARLQDYGISALPKLTDILPELILKPTLRVDDTVREMAKREEPDQTRFYHQ